MAKGKNGRTKVEAAHISSSPHNSCKCLSCVANRSNQSGAFCHKNYQDVQDAIDYHWKTLSDPVRKFLLDDPSKIYLGSFVDFWSNPARVSCTSGNIAISLCGSSWYLANNYLRIGKLQEARALVLNGAFLQECYNKSIAEVQKVWEETDKTSLLIHNSLLPYFCTALRAAKESQTMGVFLQKAMPSEYQRMMNFASKSANGPVIEYVDLISSDWNNCTAAQNKVNKQCIKAEEGDLSIDVLVVDTESKEEVKMSICLSSMLKSLFNDYAETRGSSLRSLRFTYEGKTLFLSSAGKKTPTDLGMQHLSVINVTHSNPTSDSKEESSTLSSRAKKSKSISKKGTNKGKGKGKKHAGTLPPSFHISEKDHKIIHSQALTLLFNEAEPKFREIRQKLNSLNLERSQPKKRSKSPRTATANETREIPSTVGLGGKAGKTSFVVHVGEVDNLYKTSKPSVRRNALRNQRLISIDLHGLSREEALSKLNESLPRWNDTALQSSYPFVIPIQIVCGGGNQILSETVESWIKTNVNVSNAPKNFFPNFRAAVPNAA